MTTTYEEAKLCPKCEQPGEVRNILNSKDKRGKPVKVHMIYCVTELCRWYNTAWAVQVNADGSIPEAYSSAFERKNFVKASDETITKIEENILAQLRAETRPGGGEIRGKG